MAASSNTRKAGKAAVDRFCAARVKGTMKHLERFRKIVGRKAYTAKGRAQKITTHISECKKEFIYRAGKWVPDCEQQEKRVRASFILEGNTPTSKKIKKRINAVKAACEEAHKLPRA